MIMESRKRAEFGRGAHHRIAEHGECRELDAVEAVARIEAVRTQRFEVQRVGCRLRLRDIAREVGCRRQRQRSIGRASRERAPHHGAYAETPPPCP